MNNNINDEQPTVSVPRIPDSQNGRDRENDNGNRRRRKRGNTGCLTGILYFMLVVGVSGLLAGFGWQCARDVLGFMKPNTAVEIVVPKNFTLYDLSKKMGEAGLIEKPWLFRVFGRISKAEDKIVPGTYTLQASLDYRAMVNGMTARSTLREEVRVTIPEGLTVEQIFEVFLEKGVIGEGKLEDYRECAESYDFEYDFIRVLPTRPNRLEGYLCPDTYDFYINEDPKSAIAKMLSNFNRKMSKDFKERITEMDSSIADIVTIASMIQNEAANTDEMEIISSVIYNRLKSNDYPTLGIDATIQYILPTHKEKLTKEDLEIDSPYNTRKYSGLPPGPISNPGLDAIRAALYPEETSYYFYALTKDGTHKFTKNLTEHNKVIADNPEVYGG